MVVLRLGAFVRSKAVGLSQSKPVLRRLDGVRCAIDHPYPFPTTLFARDDVRVEVQAVQQLLQLVSLEHTLSQLDEWQRSGRIKPFWGSERGHIASIALTPDFHRGAAVPVGTVIDARGFVIPDAVGNDIGCGMRLLVTDLPVAALEACWETLAQRLRGIFFRGERNIPMSGRQRESLLRRGLWGLLETCHDNAQSGAWRWYDPKEQEEALAWTHFDGAMPTVGAFAFEQFIRGSGATDGRDPQIGSVGGGNHFVELQAIDELADGPTAHAWNLSRGKVAIMVHSGSVGLGHMVGGWFSEVARSIYPKSVPHPKHDFYPLPTNGPHAHHARDYLDAMHNAAHFAFGNRLFLGLMAVRALEEATGCTIHAKLVYDAPHNLIWPLCNDQYLHRKGATPALGADGVSTPFGYTGHPVIIPGSMGDASHLLAGLGHAESHQSACHGAGRALSRGRSAHVSESAYQNAVERLRIVNPIDPNAPEVRRRPDILEAYHHRLKEEAPYAYKPITPVIQSVQDAGIARSVAKLRPLLTVKG